MRRRSSETSELEMTRVEPKARRRQAKPVAKSARDFDYSLDYRTLNFRLCPEIYRVGKGEQGVLMVEPYKSEILPNWRFKAPPEARKSALAIARLFRGYKKAGEFVGMDMARKFLQMGYTRARRYANHASGRKYGVDGSVLALEVDAVKAQSARVFYDFWKAVEGDKTYARMKAEWKAEFG